MTKILLIFLLFLIQNNYSFAIVVQNPIKGEDKILDKLTGVCAILIQDLEEKTKITLSTGTYIGKVHNTGFILTAAHPVAGKTKSISILFGTNISKPRASVSANKWSTHPEFSVVGATTHDLAVLEFDAEKLPDFVVPLKLYAGTQYKEKPLLNGIVLGFGKYGTNHESKLSKPGTLHTGFTNVTFREGDQAFSNLSRFVAYLAPKKWELKGEKQIKSSSEPNHYFHPEAQLGHFKPYPEKQCNTTDGDSGGPLLFKSKTSEFKLAGVHNGVTRLFITVPTSSTLFEVMGLFWEPIIENMHWLSTVIPSSLLY